MEPSRKIAQAVATGKVVIGTEKSLKAIKRGQAKLVIVASNCSRDVMDDIKHYSKLAGIQFRVFDEDSTALGLACGKPFSVNVLAVVDPGNSDILSTEELR